MELKELILSTLEELDEKIVEDGVQAEARLKAEEERVELEILQGISEQEKDEPSGSESDEVAFLTHSRERMLVLFEGLQATETKNIEAKLDITLNFLEYYLATIEERLDEKA